MRRRVMEGIDHDVMSVFAKVPRRGAETGGILLGRYDASGIVVEDFEPAPSEHRFGPLYRLSEEDRKGLEESLRWFRGGGQPGLDVVGYYRSQARPGFELGEEDRELLERAFEAGERTMLLIAPSRTRGSQAGFFFWRDGRMEQALSPKAFPFADSELPLVGPVASGRNGLDRDSADAPPAAVNGHAVPREIGEQPRQPSPAEGEASRPADNAGEPQADRPADPIPIRNWRSVAEESSAPEPAAEAEPARLVPLPSAYRCLPEEQPENSAEAAGAEPSGPIPAMYRRFEDSGQKPAPRHNWRRPAIAAALAAGGIVLGYLGLRPVPVVAPAPAATATPPARPTLPPAGSFPGSVPDTAPMPNKAPPKAKADTARREEESAVAESSRTAGAKALLDRWAKAMRRGNADAAAACYTPRVYAYMSKRNVSRAEVRDSIRRTLGHGGKMEVYRLSDVKIVRTGRDELTATFRKHWQTGGAHKQAGEERDRLTLVRSQGQWKIASEQQQELYWVHQAR